jgi:omega-3 fatty acid desaturase (delta-15 desaturase)
VHGPDDKFYLKFIECTGTYSLFGWFSYMVGLPDGGHWIPISGRLWNNDYNIYTHIHSIFSSIMVFGWFYFLLYVNNFNFYTFMEWYGMSWLVFSWWITTVTYLQHHDNTREDTLVYGDKSWAFVKGALQTVDRSYGTVIDNLTHNITNGHLVHHIFFRQIPHYHLEKATRYLYKYFDENGIEYKYRYTPFFFIDIFRYTTNHMSEVNYVY